MDGATVSVAVVASRTEAELIVGMLRSHGVSAAVSADDAGGQYPQMQIEGVRVLVAPPMKPRPVGSSPPPMTPPRTAYEDGYLVVGAEGAATFPGVFAGGDLTPGLQLVQVAAGSGATARIGCALSLENDPRTPPPLPPDLEDQVQVTSTGRTS